jgi:alpha-glucosidase
MACDLPENYVKHPDAFRFIEAVPCDWERSVLVDGKIGDFCIFARQERGSGNWYIGGITDEEERTVDVPLAMLPDGEYQLTLWTDAEEADWQTRPYAYEIKEYTVCNTDTLHIRMAAGGGFAAQLLQN